MRFILVTKITTNLLVLVVKSGSNSLWQNSCALLCCIADTARKMHLRIIDFAFSSPSENEIVRLSLKLLN